MYKCYTLRKQREMKKLYFVTFLHMVFRIFIVAYETTLFIANSPLSVIDYQYIICTT